jgi:DNA replication protein DnaC
MMSQTLLALDVQRPEMRLWEILKARMYSEPGLRVPRRGPPTVTPELRALLRRVKLGRRLDTLPERLALAATGGMGHAEFLESVLADEVTRRETTSAGRRARAAGLDPTMTLDRWDDTAKVTYDHAVWNELCSLRVVDSGHNAVVMDPVGVGKTFLATALGHAAVRRRHGVHFERCDRMLKRLRASRPDHSHDAELRKLPSGTPLAIGSRTSLVNRTRARRRAQSAR